MDYPSPVSPTSPLPSVIEIDDLQPLNLPKTNTKKGRPFKDTFNARFLCFNTVDDLITTLLIQRDHDTVRLINFDVTDLQFIDKYELVQLIKHNSLNMNIKSPEDLKFKILSINFNKNDNIFLNLCNNFNIKFFSLIKIIRNNKGKLIKFEILSTLNFNLNIHFLKKFITFPRYKSNMKIYLINGKFDKNICFYNDLRMLLWDIKNSNLGNKRILINNLILE